VKDFGRHLLPDWPLDPAIVYLNHGTVGVPPRRVLAAQQALRDEIERSPSRFMLRELSGVGFLPTGGRPRFRIAADAVAGFLGILSRRALGLGRRASESTAHITRAGH
jgi:isopenicillin-N epimerase